MASKMLDKFDRRLPLEGWKAALTGFIALLLPWVNELLLWIGVTPMPEPFVAKTQALLTAFVGLFILMKANRRRMYNGRK